MVTLQMSLEAPGRELRENEIAQLPGVSYVGPGTIFDAPDAWYTARRHWRSLSIVETAEADKPDPLAKARTPAFVNASHPEPPPAPKSEADARETDLASLSYRELKAMARDLNLKSNGSADALRGRLADRLEAGVLDEA